jgi:cell division protein FtsL
VLAALVGFALFHLKYQVQALEDQLAKLNRSIVHEQEQIHVLRAEWTYLDRPERIEQLAQKYLDLAPPKASQIGTIAGLPMRDAESADPASLQSRAEPTSGAKSAAQRRPWQPAPTPVAASARPNFAAEHSAGIDANPSLPGGGR